MKRLITIFALITTGYLWAERVPPGSIEEIRERLTPIGEVCMEGQTCGQAGAAVAGGAGLGLSGEQIYNQFCFACHLTGVSDAPKFGDHAAWVPHLDKGLDAMWASTLNGLNAMPPRGTCMTCTDEELRSAMDYMVDNAQ